MSEGVYELQDVPKPNRYNKIYKESFPEEMIELGKQGYLPARIASHFGVTRECLIYWRKKYPEFQEAFELAKTHCLAKFVENLTLQSFGEKSKGNAVVTIYLMKCAWGGEEPEWLRDGYSKVEITNEHKFSTMSSVDIKRNLAEHVMKFLDGNKKEEKIVEGEFDEVRRD